jgi:signal transduction histidine kinase
MNIFSLKNGFWLALSLTVIVGSVFNFIALRQSDITESSGQMVVLSYQIIDETNKISRDFERLEQTSESKSEFQRTELKKSLQTHISNLKNMTATNPAQQAEIEQLSSLLTKSSQVPGFSTFSGIDKEAIRQSLRKITESEEGLLKAVLEKDQIQNQKARHQVLVASLCSLFLLGFIAYVWVMDSRQRRRTERTLSDAIQSISRANFELEQASLVKTHLLRATAHDLRNPLGSIKGLADLISEESTHPTVTEMSGIIRQVSMQTLELVNSLIEPNALATGKTETHFVPFDMVKCLEDICLSEKPLALQKNQTIHFSHDSNALVLPGDAGKIWDLFMNLVGNAIKFSPPGGNIYLRARKDSKNVYVEVEDQGPGFTEEDITKAFHENQRLSAQPTAGEPSTGLGLSLAKEIVTRHHGSIEIHNSRSGKGACLLVSLPL